ncbi:MAG: cytochrome c oxidase subunit 3 family protein [Myxococcales bacterium]|nr:cytochrome c oxidase subunit 3 family protein [Myxococcales bacterium]
MPPAEVRAAHFASAEQQLAAARMGMWLFVASEVLLFTGLFVAYAAYRFLFPETFAQASRHLDLFLGTLNTVVLITSSLTVALAVHFASAGRSKLAAAMLAASIAFGVAFLLVKAREYGHHFETRALPGRHYGLEGLTLPGASLFFTLYFFMTGLHALHVLVGVGVLGWVAARCYRGDFSAEYHTPVELGGMYWHLVDLVWIFLYPMLYLI